MTKLCALILAAGKGTRMVSSRAKVLHEVCGEPMLRFVYRAAASLEPEKIFVVIGQDADLVRSSLEGLPARFVLQASQLGTGHAVISAREELAGRHGDLLVLTGDTPRIKPETLRKLVEHHRRTRASTTLLTTCPPDASGYGRILRGTDNSVTGIVEEKDASPEQKKIGEINAAFYCFDIPSLLDALSKLSADNAQKEYYLTDVVGIQRNEGRKIAAVLHEDPDELQGINNRRELALISKCLWREKNLALMAAGVTIVDPEQTLVDPGVSVDKDAVIYPQVKLEGRTHIGEGAIIRSGTRITNSRIGKGAEILDLCVIADCEVGDDSTVGPYCRLSNRAAIGPDCRIGSFVEISRSKLGRGTAASNAAFLSNAIIGGNVQIGTGASTIALDGRDTDVTIIEDDVIVGANSRLIAPVCVEKGARIAPGSCLPEKTAAGAAELPGKPKAKKPKARSKKRDDQLQELHQLGRREPPAGRG